MCILSNIMCRYLYIVCVCVCVYDVFMCVCVRMYVCVRSVFSCNILLIMFLYNIMLSFLLALGDSKKHK